jgi:hypothetical protein
MQKISNALCNGGKNHETMFPIVHFLAKHILGIVGTFQIETERIFSLAGIFTNLKKCHL